MNGQRYKRAMRTMRGTARLAQRRRGRVGEVCGARRELDVALHLQRPRAAVLGLILGAVFPRYWYAFPSLMVRVSLVIGTRFPRYWYGFPSLMVRFSLVIGTVFPR